MKLSINVTPMSLEPIAHEYDLRCSPAHAFDVYVNRIGEWWHPDYTANPHSVEAVTIEPRAGGRVYATHRDEGEDTWDTLQSGSRLADSSTRPRWHKVRTIPARSRCDSRLAEMAAKSGLNTAAGTKATRPTAASSRTGRSSSTVSPRSRTRPQPGLVLR